MHLEKSDEGYEPASQGVQDEAFEGATRPQEQAVQFVEAFRENDPAGQISHAEALALE
jgi:hypothetical protein